MIVFYFYLVLVNAAVTAGAGVAVLWKSRYQAAGRFLGCGVIAFAVWLVAYAQYYRPLEAGAALTWAKVTLMLSFLNQPLILHGIFAHVGKTRRLQWWLVAFYGVAVLLVGALWQGMVVTGLRAAPYMDHYVAYNPQFYPVLGIFYLTSIGAGLGTLWVTMRQAVGYRRTQLVYFMVAWGVVIATTYFVVVPIEYGFNTPPVGFFVLPINMAFLAYVLSKARLADFNVVVARVLLHATTLLVVVVLSVMLIGGVLWFSPDFLDQRQIAFTIILVLLIGLALTVSLPRLLPRMERLMQERMFGKKYGYQDALAGLVQEISHLANLDELFQRAATTVHSQMQLSRVLILMQDSLSGQYRLQAESGLPGAETTEGLSLRDDAMIVRWLQERKDLLVRDEVQRTESAETISALATELDRLQAAVCVPMNVDDQLVGIVCLGAKANNEMFFVSDLRVLETLATEVGLAVKYRRMEEQILRKNKLIELGTIAAGVAHEIRNPLASIRTFAQLLPDQIDDPEFKVEFSKLVLKDVDRITKVVESMLAFARPAQVAIAEHKATELVEEAVLLVQARLKSKRIELIREFHEESSLRVDRQQILQVLVNLLSNAADALPEQGKIRVATGVKTLESPEPTGNGADRYVVIEVADNGPGIPPLVRNRIFDPFFTTKKEGTGLGLSISQKIARDHGGIITVSSVEGKGSTFQVNLPLAT